MGRILTGPRVRRVPSHFELLLDYTARSKPFRLRAAAPRGREDEGLTGALLCRLLSFRFPR
jgi:hypothetical protein